jgi:hypothetical protein
METLIHADIFFFVTTVWVVIVSAIFVYILWNVARIVNDAKHISRKIRDGSDVLSQDLNELRTAVRSNVHTKREKIKYLIKYFKHIFARRQNHKK